MYVCVFVSLCLCVFVCFSFLFFSFLFFSFLFFFHRWFTRQGGSFYGGLFSLENTQKLQVCCGCDYMLLLLLSLFFLDNIVTITILLPSRYFSLLSPPGNFEKHNNHLQHPPTNLARPLPSTTTHAAAKAAARLSVSHSPPPRPPSPSTSSHFFDEKGEEGKEEGKGELEKKREKEKEKENDRGGKRGLGKEKKKEKREDNQKGEGEEEVEALREKLQRDRQTLLRLLEETQTQQKNFRKKLVFFVLAFSFASFIKLTSPSSPSSHLQIFSGFIERNKERI